MTVRKGLSGGSYRPLSPEQIKQIDETTFRVLSEVGVQVNFPEARELFARAGAQVDQENSVVKIPEALARELISRAPSEIVLCGRAADGRHDLKLGGARVYMGTGGTALNVQDPGADDNRPAQLADVADMAPHGPGPGEHPLLHAQHLSQ